MIAGHPVHGYCEETKMVYEYHGCDWHGCKECHKENRTKDMDFKYEKTRQVTEKIRAEGYEVYEAWGCQVDWWVRGKLTKKNKKVPTFYISRL